MPRTLAEHLAPDSGSKRMLALDGGGVKGTITLGMLTCLEDELRRRAGGNPDFRLSDYYDLIGGTSTGSIIATGLALGLSVRELMEFYLDLGPRIFGQRTGDGMLRGSKFDGKQLRKALMGVIGLRTLGTDQLETGLALFAKRIDTGSAWTLTNHPDAIYYDPPADTNTFANKRYRLIDIVQASAAAPTFFDEVTIRMEYDEKDRRRKDSEGYFVDGAVGGHNNPSVQMLLLALTPAYGFKWQRGADRLMMTSIGTGYRRPRIEGRKFASMLAASRGVHALKSMIHDTVKHNIAIMQSVSHPQIPWPIDSEINGQDGVCITGEPMLDFQRIDVVLDTWDPKQRRSRKNADPLPTELEKLIGQALTKRQFTEIDALDCGRPENLELLRQIGLKAGEKYISAAYPSPAFDLPEWKTA
jgi:hypothetical protein